MQIREARLTDFEGIFRLYKTVAAQGYGIARFEDEITEGYVRHNLEQGLSDGIVLVAESESQIVAEIHTYRIGIRIFEHVLSNLTIAIHPNFQGKGIGYQLFRQLLDKVENDMPHILRVELHARDGNEAAIRLYKKLGFELEGYLKNRDKMPDGQFYHDISFGWMNKNYRA
ncbi:MAG: GNAT family N-acetyltransferase [Saprospiraceae bacterium]|nr:GNAT family N-acetyltransferase [Saprospiraceae bacterium]